MGQTSLGFSTHLGWCACTATLIQGVEIAATRTFRLTTAEPDDRLALEPYHVAGGFDGLNRVPPPSEPDALVELGLTRQRTATLAALGELLDQLTGWPRPARAGLLTGRGRQAASLEKVLSSHTQIHVAEGNAVRESVTLACGENRIEVIALDRKTLSEIVLDTLQVEEADLHKKLAQLRPENGGSWRKEEKICAIVALLAACQSAAV